MTETAWQPPVPQHWSVHRADQLCTIVSGSTPRTSVPEFWGGDIVWVTPNDQEQGAVDVLTSGERTITQEGLESCSTTLVPTGSVLLSSRAPIGYVSVAGREVCTNQGFKTFVAKEGVELEPRFLMWWLRANRSRLEGLGSGTTFKELSKRAASTIPVPLPPMEEQRAVVEVIEAILSRVAAAQADEARAKRRLATLRDAILERAMQGGPLSSPIGDAESELLEVNETLDRHQDKVDEQDRPRWLPSGWAWVTLRTAIGSGGLITDGDWVETKDQDPAGSIRLLQLSDVGRGEFRDRSSRFINEVAAKRLDVTEVYSGDILVARLGDPPGDATLVPDLSQRMITAVDVCIIRPEPGAVTAEWLMWCLNSPRFRASVVQHQSGTTRKRIARTKLEQLCVPVPPRDGQKHIVTWIKQEMTRVARLEEVLAVNEDRSSTLRRSILKAAFEGRLTTTNDTQLAKDPEEAVA